MAPFYPGVDTVLQLLRLAPHEVYLYIGKIRLGALRCASGLLLTLRPRIRMGADANGLDQKVDAASETTPAYPYCHQRQFVERIPLPIPTPAPRSPAN